MAYFDPLSYENLGASIARALDEQPVIPLVDLAPFEGPGIYALYYHGDFPAYSAIAHANRQECGSWPIYIGKAESESGRKGDPNQTASVDGPRLFNRIKNHKRSIALAENLDVADFSFRALTIAPTWVSLAEVIAIREHKPVWNAELDGFGNHAPGSGRANMQRPKWDTLHPGRPWATDLTARDETQNYLEVVVQEYLRRYLP